MKLWQKITISSVAMLAASFAAGRSWLMALDFVISGYLAGVAGGITAIPVWELMRWIDTK